MKTKILKYHPMFKSFTIKIFIGILAVPIFLSSCEKMIDVDQPDIIEQEQAFDDKNTSRLSLLGLYGYMTDLVEPMFLAGEVRADLTIAAKSADAYIKEFSNNSFSASNPYISPKPYYTIINNANDFIARFDKMYEEGIVDSSEYHKFKSELVAIRVWTQYQIAKIYGKCKYYTEVVDIDNVDNLPDLAFDKGLINKLIEQLTFSDTNNFTSTDDDLKWQTIRMNDFYVNALLGELYMDLALYDSKAYELAIEKFDEVISAGDINNRAGLRFKITTPKFDEEDTDWIDYLFIDDDITLFQNAVFIIGFDNKYNQTNNLYSWTQTKNYQVEPSDWFFKDFNKQAFANSEFPDYRYYSVDYSTNDPYSYKEKIIYKYFEDDKPFILTRTARIKLLMAYCINQTEGYEDALDEVNDVRGRVNASELELLDDKIEKDKKLSKLWMEDVIIDELAYETAFEGQRWFDLMRVAKRRKDPSYLANKVAEKYPNESKEEIVEKLSDKKNWYIPVFE